MRRCSPTRSRPHCRICRSSAMFHARPTSLCPNAISAWCKRPSIPISSAFSIAPPSWSARHSMSLRSSRWRVRAAWARSPARRRSRRWASASPSRAISPSPSPIRRPSTAGAELLFFSPLADEAPDGTADAVILPGGYPELHAGALAGRQGFFRGLRDAARRGAAVYGVCGGYMVLGEGLVDAAGTRHAMAGLLPLETSFAARRRHLGYRRARLLASGPLGAAGSEFRGHEFHYATILGEGDGAALFAASDADGAPLGTIGRARGKVQGSFLHLVDRAR